MKTSKWTIPIMICASILCFRIGYLAGLRRGSSTPTNMEMVASAPIKTGETADGRRLDKPGFSPTTGTTSPESRLNARLSRLIEREKSGDERAKERIKTDEYEMMLVYAGLSPSQIESILPAISDSIRLSMIEEQASIDAITAKKVYEDLLKANLSPEQLASYTGSEKMRAAKKEMEQFEEFAKESGLNIDGDRLDAISNEIFNAKAYSRLAAHGPSEARFERGNRF